MNFISDNFGYIVPKHSENEKIKFEVLKHIYDKHIDESRYEVDDYLLHCINSESNRNSKSITITFDFHDGSIDPNTEIELDQMDEYKQFSTINIDLGNIELILCMFDELLDAINELPDTDSETSSEFPSDDEDEDEAIPRKSSSQEHDSNTAPPIIDDFKSEVIDFTKTHKVSMEIINESKKDRPKETNIMYENRTHIVRVITAMIQKCNTKDYLSVVPKNYNIFRLAVSMRGFTGSLINRSFDEYEKMYGKCSRIVQFTLLVPDITFGRMPIIPDFDMTPMDSNFIFNMKHMKYFKSENWNPINNIHSVIQKIYDCINEHGAINMTLDLVTNALVNIEYTLGIEKPESLYSFDFVKLSYDKLGSKDSSGTGYSSYGDKSVTLTDIKSLGYEKHKFISSNMHVLRLHFMDKVFDSCDANREFLKYIDLMEYYYSNISVTDTFDYSNEYESVAVILRCFSKHYVDLCLEYEEMNRIYKMNSEIRTFTNDITKFSQEKFSISFDFGDTIKILKEVIQLFDRYETIINDPNFKRENGCTMSKENRDTSYNLLLGNQISEGTISNFSYSEHSIVTSEMKKAMIKNLMILRRNLPFSYETSIFCRYSEEDMTKLRFMIIGPKDTPYQDGCYIFDMYLPTRFPNVCPKVKFLTTGKGTVRFNPNLYNSGKVCLSLLGTWEGEGWTTESTLLQVLISIQSLILVEEPYFNEPGYQRSKGTPAGTRQSNEYNKNIRNMNIRWAIIENILNPPNEFEFVMKHHFMVKRDEIIQMAKDWKINSELQERLKIALDHVN